MKRDDAINVILRRAGQRQGDSNLEAQILDEMQLAQEQMEENGVQLPLELSGGVFWPHFLVSDTTSLSTTANDPKVSLPDDFLMEYEDGALFLYNVGGGENFTPLVKDDWDILRSNYGKGDTGEPKYYALTGPYFYVSPVPDASYDLRLLYYQKAAALDSNVENGWLQHAPKLMIGHVGETVAGEILYDNELAKRFTRQKNEAALQLYYSEVARQQVNYEPIKGDRV